MKILITMCVVVVLVFTSHFVFADKQNSKGHHPDADKVARFKRGDDHNNKEFKRVDFPAIQGTVGQVQVINGISGQ